MAGCTPHQESLDTPTDHHTTAAIILQSSWRKLVTRKSYLQIRSATLTLQKTWRGYKARQFRQALAHERDNKAASTIQAYWKMTKERSTFQTLRSQIVTAQSNARMSIQRRKFLRTRKATIIVQRSFRARQERNHFLRQRSAAIVLQSRWREFLARQSF